MARHGSDQRSPEALQWRAYYRTARWQRTRAAQLAKQPLCETCLEQGRITPATVCHHMDKDSKADPERFYAGPFRSACAPCHNGPLQSEERTGRPRSIIGPDGWPVDSNTGQNRIG